MDACVVSKDGSRERNVYKSSLVHKKQSASLMMHAGTTAFVALPPTLVAKARAMQAGSLCGSEYGVAFSTSLLSLEENAGTFQSSALIPSG
jgi:hypothetical protein